MYNLYLLIVLGYVPTDNEESTWMKSSPAQTHLPNGVPTSNIPVQTLGGTRRVIAYYLSKTESGGATFDGQLVIITYLYFASCLPVF
jgi:hypothetical protein